MTTRAISTSAGAALRKLPGGANDTVSHNLAGQKLGRKGRDTRERILAAAYELMSDSIGEPFTMSALARRASLGMTSLYNYFPDITEVMLAVLDPVMATAEDSYLGLLDQRWTDKDLPAHCERFLRAYYDFWAQHSRLLHLRNAMSDQGDLRLMRHRVAASSQIIVRIARQMDAPQPAELGEEPAMASLIVMSVDRAITIATDLVLPQVLGFRVAPEVRFLPSAAKLLELSIREARRERAAAAR